MFLSAYLQEILIVSSTGISNTFMGLWNTVSGYLTGFLNGAKDTFKGIFDSASEKFSGVKEVVDGVVQWLKGVFDFDWHLPDIKLPEFHWSGEFSLSPLSVPHLDVEWHAKGMVLNQPTIFGVNPSNGKMMGGGEAGPEAVAPIATLQGYVQEAVRAENAGVMELLSEILAAILDYFPQLVAVSEFLQHRRSGAEHQLGGDPRRRRGCGLYGVLRRRDVQKPHTEDAVHLYRGSLRAERGICKAAKRPERQASENRAGR